MGDVDLAAEGTEVGLVVMALKEQVGEGWKEGGKEVES